MKFIHLSDLHIGKRVNEFSMLEDQEYILKEIISIIDQEKPDSIIIAGDVYDKSAPSTEAVCLFDDFLFELSKRNLKVFIISGNHDSPERIAFGRRLIDKSGIYISPVYDGVITPISLNDSYGELNIYSLPFIKPINVRRFYPDEKIESYTDAVDVAIKNMNIDEKKRNVLITHQFVTGALRSESEDISVGGSDNVDVSVFGQFDYVALGHIHRPQKIVRDTVRYCGTPLKYSISEATHDKSVTMVELAEKGNVEIKTFPLKPLRELREIKGSYMELSSKSYYQGTNTDDYIHITLTDEEEIPNALGKLRTIYKNIIKLDYDNKRTSVNMIIDCAKQAENKTPLELFTEFFYKQNNKEMDEEQTKIIETLVEKIWEQTS